MSQHIILKKSPKIEFQLLENGFEVIDGQTEENSGFYSYADIKQVELNKAWFPRLAKWLRAVTWIFNGVPLFPDAESYKKSNIIIHLRKSKLGIWLTDSSMADNARKLESLLSERRSS